MTGDAEYGRCEVCNANNAILSRKYYYYDVDCECCVGKHFAVCKYCPRCKPAEPEETKIYIKTSKLKEWEAGR